LAHPASLNRNIDAPVAGCPCSQVWRLYIASIGDELDPHMFVVAIETVGPDPLRALSAWEAQVEPIMRACCSLRLSSTTDTFANYGYWQQVS
jgi:hypothetical protein